MKTRQAKPAPRITPDSDVGALPGVGPARVRHLGQLGIRTVGDLLLHWPRAYEDRTRITPIAEALPGTQATVLAEVVQAQQRRTRGRQTFAVLTLRDDSGEMRATFFGRGFLAFALRAGTRALFTGKVEEYQGPCLRSPEYEVLDEKAEDARLHTGRVVPLYPLTDKVTQRMLRRWVALALEQLDDVPHDALPAHLRTRYGFPTLAAALPAVHFPDAPEAAEAARRRFVYEELLAMQLALLQARAAAGAQPGCAHQIDGPRLAALRNGLPFELTPAQARVADEVLGDMAAPVPMARLVQGDVGCGKTVVAMLAAAAAADSGMQTAFMAPTEVLAEQHFRNLSRMLAPAGVRVTLLTGALRGAAAIRREIAAAAVDVVVGTQALFQEATRFRRLGLVVIDEQHRFGVAQRERLRDKGAAPDLLQMSATPIPRTLALSVYGALDVSVIDALPPGRQPVQTSRVPARKVADCYRFVAEQAAAGHQAYIICPLVAPSDVKALKAAIEHYEDLAHGPLAGTACALLHGQLDPAEKADILARFAAGEVAVLLSTTVVEVGVDVPAATIMVIEDAPQFGLTQLHQLRGRVGRGAAPAHCFLLGTPTTEDGRTRLQTLCDTNDGFAIAEADLRQRGPGEFAGVRQAGLNDLRLADLARDAAWLERARDDAVAMLRDDPQLTAPEHVMLARAARRFARAAGG